MTRSWNVLIEPKRPFEQEMGGKEPTQSPLILHIVDLCIVVFNIHECQSEKVYVLHKYYTFYSQIL